MMRAPLLPITFGRATGQPADMHPRHRHEGANLAIVLTGGYLEAGDCGRRRVTAGDVLIHGAFEAHLNRFSARKTEVLSLPLPARHGLPIRGAVKDPDAIVRQAGRDEAEAVAMVVETLVADSRQEQDWPDLLAASLADNQDLCLHSWAEQHSLRPGSVSRGFRLAYGATPRQYRAERRVHKAWRIIMSEKAPLAQIAIECGFADQSHMNRAIVLLTGRSPGAWRKWVKSIQDGPKSA